MKSFECSRLWCKRVFKSKFNKQRDEKTCKNKNPDHNKCFMCKKVFTHQTHLQHHMKTYSEGKQRLMRCKKYKKRINRKDLLEQHQLSCAEIDKQESSKSHARKIFTRFTRKHHLHDQFQVQTSLTRFLRMKIQCLIFR